MPTKLSGRAAVRGQVKFGVADAAEQSLDLDPFSVASRRIMVVDASRECDRRSARFGLLPDATTASVDDIQLRCETGIECEVCFHPRVWVASPSEGKSDLKVKRPIGGRRTVTEAVDGSGSPEHRGTQVTYTCIQITPSECRIDERPRF